MSPLPPHSLSSSSFTRLLTRLKITSHGIPFTPRNNSAICLLENGANPNIKCKMGLTPLHLAAKQQGSQKLIQLLISKGAEVNAGPTAYSGTPLLIAASVGEKDAVKILLDNHADPNANLNDTADSPLGAAICAHSIDCVKLLLQAGANPNNELERAVLLRETEIIKCLLAAGANPNARNAFDMTPLEVAAIKGLLECVLVLFPVSAPIAGVTDWSIAGIMKYGQTDKAKRKMEKKREEEFLLSKSKGEAAVRRNEYIEAAKCYTECLSIEPSDATILSNRSLCWAKLNSGDLALSDAQACISRRPDRPKGYYREGVAWNLLKDFKKAADS